MAKQQQQLETCRVEVRGVDRSVPLASVEDMETALIREVGPGRLLAHGTALKPSSTTSTAASSTSSTAPSAADGAAPGTDSATGGAPATGPAAAPVAPAAPAAASAVYVFREAIDGAFMGRPFPVWTMLKTLPLAGAVTALGTLAVCYSVAHAGRHLPFQLPLPYVSLLGYRSPERWLYLGGFASVAAVFLAAAVPLYVAMSWFVERSNRLLWRTVGFWVAVAVMGMVGQAAIPLQHNVHKLLQGTGDAVDAKLTLQSKVHQGCAALFFFGTVASCVALLQLAYLSRNTCHVFSSRSLSVKAALIAVGVVPAAFATAVQFSAKHGPGADPTTALLLPTATQWLAVLCMILYYASFALDMGAVERLLDELHTSRNSLADKKKND